MGRDIGSCGGALGDDLVEHFDRLVEGVAHVAVGVEQDPHCVEHLLVVCGVKGCGERGPTLFGEVLLAAGVGDAGAGLGHLAGGWCGGQTGRVVKRGGGEVELDCSAAERGEGKNDACFGRREGGYRSKEGS